MSNPIHRLAFMVRALRHRNFRLFFGGQFVSFCGSWMSNVATGWLVYRLTGSAWMLGVVTFAGQVPLFVLGPLTGLLVDQMEKRRGLIVVQTFSMLQSFTLAALVFSGHATVAAIVVLSLARGIIVAFEIPLRQSFLVDLVVDRNDLGNAIALNSSIFNVARLIGPSIGAVVIAAVGEAWCFFIDGVSFFGVITSFLMMRVQPSPVKAAQSGLLAGLHDGWLIVSRSGPIRRIILLLAAVSFLGVPYISLLPLFAGDILHGNARTLGVLMSSVGAGALLGAAWLAGRRSVLGLTKVIPVSAGIFGFSVMGFAFSKNLWISCAFLFVAGCCLMIHAASSNTILQTIVDDDKRGRVMAFYMMAFGGTAPFGSLLMGKLSERVGPALAIGAGGVCCVIAAVVFFSGLRRLRASIRPIYLRMGILPPVAEVVIPPEQSVVEMLPPEGVTILPTRPRADN